MPSNKQSSSSSMQNQPPAPPPGYPTGNPPKGQKNCCPTTKTKGDRGFLEGCLFALCCCWLCEVCFD